MSNSEKKNRICLGIDCEKVILTTKDWRLCDDCRKLTKAQGRLQIGKVFSNSVDSNGQVAKKFVPGAY
jgi:hypothetical protein